MRAFLDESGADYVLYAQGHDAAPFLVIHEAAGYLGERYAVPSYANELFPEDIGAGVTRTKVLAEVRTALAAVKMSKAARAAVDEVLDDLAEGDDG